MGRIALDRPNPRALDCWRNQQGMKGLRLVFNAEHRALLTEGTADWVWPAAECAGLPVMVLAPGFLSRIGEIAEKHPQLRLVIDHMGAVRHAKGKDAFAHLPDLIALARFPNVAVKASGLPGYSAEPHPFRDMHAPLRRTIDAFGPNRVFWGTDLSRMPCSYRACVTAFTEEFAWQSGAERDRVMGSALCDWIGWPRPNGPAN
jgi:predicted TIM-barrel fold metal-dependent hydrolase